VDDPAFVALLESYQELAGVLPQHVCVHEELLSLSRFLDVVDNLLLEVIVTELEHELEVLHLGVDDLQQIHDVRVVQLFQQRDFA